MARQLRIALSMNGGVSLAVWIGGAVAEIDELRRGEGFWGDVLESCGYERKAQVDVLAGASAGGLNGVLLAQAIRTNQPFAEFLDLWRIQADIDQLVKFRDEVNAVEGTRSVMRGEYFRQELADALPDDATEKAIDQDLQLFASATLLVGAPETYRDVQGEPLRDTRSGAYFTVARRGTAARGLDGFAIAENRDALAKIGRATSSLPTGFEPVPFDSGDTLSRLAQAFSPASTSVEVIDGGVLDNIPIARAIKAISSSRAAGRTRRVLVYLHPNPSSTDPAPGDGPNTAVKVLRKFLGKRKESLREDIDELRAHNLAVRQQHEMVLRQLELLLAGSFGPEQLTELQLQDATTDLQCQSAAALIMRCAVAPDAEIAWHSPTRPRLASMVDRDDGIAIDELGAAVDAALRVDSDLLPAHRTARIVRALRWLVHDVERGDLIDLGEVKEQLYELELLCDLAMSYQLGNFVAHTDATSAAASLRGTAATLRSLTSGDTDSWWTGLATWQLVPGDQEPLPDCLVSRLEEIRAGIGAAVADTDEVTTAVEVLTRVCNGTLTLDEVDRAFGPLATTTYVSAQSIDFVRIAGNASSPVSERFEQVADSANSGNPKIAGTQLGHLGAFFDPDWRVNDWWWGRLDAVPSIAAAIVDDQAFAAYRNRLDAGPETDPETDPAAATTASELVEMVVRKRQVELLQMYRATQVDSPAAGDDPTNEPWFEEWARRDRRVASLVGSVALTRTALRAVTVASELLRQRAGLVMRAILPVLRPVVLAITGIVLAGRRASAATAWTLCVLAAPRLDTEGSRWTVWALGLLAVGVILYLTERRVKPPVRPWWWRHYAWAVAGVVVGGVIVLRHEQFVDGTLLGFDDQRMIWMVPALAAGVSAAMLFFWMPTAWRWLTITIITVAYGFGAWLATWAAKYPEHGIAMFWPLHSLWVYWIVLVLVVPVVVSLFDRTLLPRRVLNDES